MKISLCLCVWNTSHLLKRSLITYEKQNFPKNDWEIIVIDDNSEDNVLEVLQPFIDRNVINISYKRLNHAFGMRGNTVAFNTAFSMAKGEVIAETTPEILLTPNTIQTLWEHHEKDKRCFVAIKTYNLVSQTQLLVDSVDWQTDIMNIAKLPGFNDPFTQANKENTNFRTHQLCSIRKDVFYEITNGLGFPLYGDYGTEDPMYSGLRETVKPEVKNITIMDFMCIHQWHLPFQYWMSKGKAPYLNKWAHSCTNFLNDRSGKVPDGGTCEIWDKGNKQRLNLEEREYWSQFDELYITTGGMAKI